MVVEWLSQVDPWILAEPIRVSNESGRAYQVSENIFNLLVTFIGLGAFWQAAKSNFGRNSDKKEGLQWTGIGILLILIGQMVMPLVGMGQSIFSSMIN